ncbi:MAG: aminoglycoside phosphotransferase family protein [Lachnospiraceae bacterium]|nr:aminoglycoside phosphotransferase family protein [Lachnospiraceae bacterium]
MIKSRTKYEAGQAEISSLFRAHGIGNVTGSTVLGDGEFNSAYKVTCEGGKDYVLKIAPPGEAAVLSYEKNMMDSEVYWYRKMKENTDILCPDIYAVDFSCSIIKSCCFIMQMMDGEPLWKCDFTPEEAERVRTEKIGMLAKIHGVKNDRYGYRQSGLYDSWYEALRSMADRLVRDCKNIGYESPDGEEFIRLIDMHEDVLRDAPCRMVNFDLWDSNVLYDNGKLVWIDPERGFWGDPVADLITVGKGQKAPLSDKKKEIDIYNRTAAEKIGLNRNTEIRYACAVAYLALIEEVEKYVRYEPENPNYIRNTVDARDMYDMAFGVMRQ